jgi:CheY-like chemotaxis protein
MTASKQTVLIVDDDPGIRDAMSDVLLDEGYPVATAGDGMEALDYLRTNPPPGVILLDWMLPRCYGAQIRAEQLRDPRLAGIPTVLITADPKIQDKTGMLDMHEHLAKPLELTRLLEVVQRYCG